MSLTPEQRNARLTRVGASEVAALLDPPAHPFTTARDIWERIVYGMAPEVNGPMQVGQLMEPYVLAAARKRWRINAIACTRAYVHHYLPVTASPDAYVGDGAGLVEVKVTSATWVDQPPPYVIAQVQCQLWLARRSYAHVVVLSGSRLELFTVERDVGLISAIEDGVDRFAGAYLFPVTPPPGPDPTFMLTRGT